MIPTDVWKVALILPRDEGLADVHDYRDVQVVAVIMPNQAGVRYVDWHTYETTVDAVEALSGYDLLSLLPDRTERAVESGTEPPLGALDGPYTSTEGAPVAMSAAASVDPNGSIVDYAWTFGDGATGAGVGVTHTYAQDGDYAVSLVVTDNDGLVDTVTTTAHVANVAPAIAPIPDVTVIPGEPYAFSGSFTDPGADPWSATVDYGDGAGTEALPLDGHTFALSHTYCAAGAHTVGVTVTDDHVTSSGSGVVTVLTPAEAVTGRLQDMVQALVDAGRLEPGIANGLAAKLTTAASQLAKGHTGPAANLLRAFQSEVAAQATAGHLDAADAAALTAAAAGVGGCLES